MNIVEGIVYGLSVICITLIIISIIYRDQNKGDDK